MRRSIASRKPYTLSRGSSRLSPRSRAKWLRVPAETQTNGRSCSTAIEATSAWEPSPPAIPRQSAPLAIASRASCSRSSPWSSITVSIPSPWASSTSPNRSTLPPPDHGLQISTGCLGSDVRAARSTSDTSPRSASRAMPNVIDPSTTNSPIRSNGESAAEPARMPTVTTTTTPTTSPPNPTSRRAPRRVRIHHPLATATTSPSRATIRWPPLRNRDTATIAARSTPEPRDTMAAARRRADTPRRAPFAIIGSTAHPCAATLLATASLGWGSYWSSRGVSHSRSRRSTKAGGMPSGADAGCRTPRCRRLGCVGHASGAGVGER